jgi:hypothetical protein
VSARRVAKTKTNNEAIADYALGVIDWRRRKRWTLSAFGV